MYCLNQKRQQKILILIIFFLISFNPVSANQHNDDISKKIKSQLPSGAYLREYEKLTDVMGDIYVGLYVTDYSDPLIPVFPQNQMHMDNLFYTCPEETQGQSLSGNYYAFAFKDDKIISSCKIPVYDEDLSIINSFSLYNSPFNNCRFFKLGENKNCSNLSKSILEKTDLIELNDLTGDGNKNEFLLTGIQEACGFVNHLVVGFDEISKKIQVYPKNIKNEYYYWNIRFVPLNGECQVVIICDDHGNEEYIREDFLFNPEIKEYELIYSETKDCY